MKNLLTAILCVFFFSANGQNYYYNGNEKVIIHKSDKSFISYDKPTESFTKGFAKVESFSIKGFAILENLKTDESAKKFRKEKLNQTVPALLIHPDSDFKMYPTRTIRVKLKANKKQHDISKLLNKNDVLEIEEKYNIVRIKIVDVHKSLEVANRIYESGIAEFSIPDFYIPMELNQINDPLFPQQFQMHNTGQVIDGIAGVNNIDVNALEAWDLNLGNNVTVAVFDQGLENHEDFGNRLIGGNTPATNGNGTPLANDATHGMNCAGVIGASDDNLGLRGVAPNVNFLSVNIFAGGTTSGDIADGIQWAIINGADVLSNSWSYSNAPCNFTNIDIENAIINAVNNGRNGDGAVIVFSAGNTGGCVNYPARNNNVLSVGAVDNRGVLFNYSSRGPELDLVAPSGQTGYLGNVRTTDRMGAAGRVPGHYENNFGGTSAAAPVVSGVAALVLSVNPNLTQQEVRDILTSTATDMGAFGFDNNFGFGRVNAFAAVQQAQIPTVDIDGDDFICSNSTKTYSLSNSNYSATWQLSSNLQLISSTSTSITVRPMLGVTSGIAFIDAIIGTATIRKNIWIGKPSLASARLTTGEYIAHTGSNTVCKSEQITTNISVSNYDTVTWSLVNSSHTTTWGQQGINLTFYLWANNHTATFKLTMTNSCGSSIKYFSFDAEDCSGGGNDPCNTSYVISPNPASTQFEITPNIPAPCDPILTNSENPQTSTASLYNFQGNLMLTQSPASGTMNVEALPSGLYVLIITTGQETTSHQIVIN